MKSESLLRACEILDQRGWSSRGSYNGRGGVCAVVALADATRENGGYWLDTLADIYPHIDHMSLQAWNDNVAKEKRQVQRLFKKVAKELQREGK